MIFIDSKIIHKQIIIKFYYLIGKYPQTGISNTFDAMADGLIIYQNQEYSLLKEDKRDVT